MRQSILQLQNEAVLMSCRIRAVEYTKSSAGLYMAHTPVFMIKSC